MVPASKPEPVRDPLQTLDGWSSVIRRLVDTYGVNVVFCELPPHQLGDWDSVSNRLLIRTDAYLCDQVWLLQQMWNYLAVGPHASAGARRQPVLSLVSDQREAPGSQTA